MKNADRPWSQEIQWYPGHMAKARRMIEENMKLVDVVCEICDARIPRSSRNPDMEALAANKRRVIVLNRKDLADPVETGKWIKSLQETETKAIACDSRSRKGVASFLPAVESLLQDRHSAEKEKGLVGRKPRIMVVGIPNVGKSSFINQLAGRKATVTGDRPGVTRGKQWISVGAKWELMDTPGILWPKFDSWQVGAFLALTNSIKNEILDYEALAVYFLEQMKEAYPDRLQERYHVPAARERTGEEILQDIARNRGCISSGGDPDLARASRMLIKEYQDGKLGKLTLEKYNGGSLGT